MPSRIGFRVAKVTSEEEGMRGSQLVEVGPQAKVITINVESFFLSRWLYILGLDVRQVLYFPSNTGSCSGLEV